MIFTIKPSKSKDEAYPTVAVSSPDNDLPCSEAVELMAAALIAWGYQPSNVVEAMFTWSNNRGV